MIVEKYTIKLYTLNENTSISHRPWNSLHALSGLSGDIYQLKHLEVGFLHVEVFVETAAFTPLRYNRKIVFCHVAHEQKDVDMSGFPVDSRTQKFTSIKCKNTLMQCNRGQRNDQNLKSWYRCGRFYVASQFFSCVSTMLAHFTVSRLDQTALGHFILAKSFHCLIIYT